SGPVSVPEKSLTPDKRRKLAWLDGAQVTYHRKFGAQPPQHRGTHEDQKAVGQTQAVQFGIAAIAADESRVRPRHHEEKERRKKERHEAASRTVPKTTVKEGSCHI